LNLIFTATILALSSCATAAAKYSIVITGDAVPVFGAIAEPFPYPGGELGVINFDGTIKYQSTGIQLKLSNFKYTRLESDRITCIGQFSRNQENTRFSFPLDCTDGRNGTAIINIDGNSNLPGQASYLSLDGHSARVGIGSFQLTDNSTGGFDFGLTTTSHRMRDPGE
jgi:hypothetical protein